MDWPDEHVTLENVLVHNLDGCRNLGGTSHNRKTANSLYAASIRRQKFFFTIGFNNVSKYYMSRRFVTVAYVLNFFLFIFYRY